MANHFQLAARATYEHDSVGDERRVCGEELRGEIGGAVYLRIGKHRLQLLVLRQCHVMQLHHLIH